MSIIKYGVPGIVWNCVRNWELELCHQNYHSRSIQPYILATFKEALGFVPQPNLRTEAITTRFLSVL